MRREFLADVDIDALALCRIGWEVGVNRNAKAAGSLRFRCIPSRGCNAGRSQAGQQQGAQ